jgi:alkylhydroperoxidase family enzyme
MHTKDARARGESEQRLYSVVVWRETPFFRERERTALAWAEAVTQVSQQHVPDEVYDMARQHFGEKELVDLTLAIVAINGWNRLAISFRKVPGTYQSKRQSADTAKSFHSNGALGTAVRQAASAKTTKGERT